MPAKANGTTKKAAAKAPAKKSSSAKSAAKTTPAKKTTAKKAATKSSATKSPATKSPATKATKQTAATASKAPAKKSASKTTSTKAAPNKAAKAAPAKSAAKEPTPARKPAKSALSAADAKELRTQITGEIASLRSEYDASIAVLDELKRNGPDNAGDDPADAGAKTFEREQEMSIANNRLDLISQMERALERLNSGTYGVCENCGNAIPKGRLQAFPSATLCVACKSREERR
ncbi:hypothetical protein GCM10027298_18350 [Epidermidibacterium keratini]